MNDDGWGTPPVVPPAGWYSNPDGSPGHRWWDGSKWSEHTANPMSIQQAPPPAGPSLKSANVALVLQILIPGAGQMYLGLTRQGAPYLVANAVGIAIGFLTLLLFPITVVIWVVTLLMTVGKISDDTQRVNAAISAGRPIKD